MKRLSSLDTREPRSPSLIAESETVNDPGPATDQPNPTPNANPNPTPNPTPNTRGAEPNA